ncbi:ArsA family ATPase [Natronospirillum operosum]|uniref:arsenite-transporting ATPase n=1 Tax=Natronospirillum operosum TaxID=2759953 RepID=A0A4Z0WFR5_9GAMM|nr:ArsA family ATPase [Natronospirillum operosum]TGG93991.1 ArsA family ATPase [Natronospirillum operosum]
MQDVLNARIVWVGGKGGVGKTTVSAALSVLAARRDKRTLVVSTDPAHSLGDVFDRELGDHPQRIMPNLDAMEIDPDAEVDRHLNGVLDQMRGYAKPDLMPELERQMRMSRQSPGTQEAALLERIARLITTEDNHYDLIIFDTAPTGHTLRLLTLPEAMAAWTDGLLQSNRKSAQLGDVMKHLTPKSGRDVPTPFDDPQEDPYADLDDRSKRIARTLTERKRLFHQARHRLEDQGVSAFVFVLTPERLPILETRRAVEALTEAGIKVSVAVVNRVIPEDADGEFLARRRVQEAEYLHRIEHELRGLYTPHLPWLETDVQGLTILEDIANRMEKLGF